MENNNSKLTLRELIGEEYLDYEVNVSQIFDVSSKGEKVAIMLLKDSKKIKYVEYAYNVLEGRPMSNLVNGLYSHSDINLGDKIFLWSYEINGKIRAFAGLANNYLGITYPVGFDLNCKQFVRLPINELGLMDEPKMKEMLRTTKSLNPKLGFDPKFYNEAIRYANFKIIISMLYNKLEYKDGEYCGSTEMADWIIKHLDEYNTSEIREVTERLEELKKKDNRNR